MSAVQHSFTFTPPVRANHLTYRLGHQAHKIYTHMRRAGSISARDAMDDYSITSATLAARICDLEKAGIPVNRIRKQHPITRRRYTRYELADTWAGVR